jgi:DNA mismatch repair protein MutL
MSKINILSSQIYNRISAGEVIERPFSVVKELVENSIDAGATSIFIDILDGGISSIVITDNGSGIEKDQLKNALLPHATSKISKLEDIDNILTLGFRGEALASITAVSKIKITSKPVNQELGAFISADGGVINTIEDCSFNNGTQICVNNLFYNTPVREKFLKSIKSEENDITSTVARFILCNPNISFKYTANGKVIYQSFGDGFESALISVYGVEAVKEEDKKKKGGFFGKLFGRK